MADLLLRAGNIIPVAKSTVQGDDVSPQQPLGTISFLNDAYGFRVLEYVHNISGAAALKGALLSRKADLAITDLVSGTTISVTDSGLTANTMQGQILYIDDNADSAGAAPEGESGIITSNTTTTINIDAARPFTVATAVSDDVRVVYSSAVVASADGDLTGIARGVVLANGGITNLQYGWIQRYGYCPDVTHKNNACVAGEPVVSDVSQVNAWGSDAVSLWVGQQVGTFTADNVHLYSPVLLNLWGFQYPHS